MKVNHKMSLGEKPENISEALLLLRVKEYSFKKMIQDIPRL